jgi:hypothetical protein
MATSEPWILLSYEHELDCPFSFTAFMAGLLLSF